MKTLLRYLSKKIKSKNQGADALRFMLGAMHGNLELYGYSGVSGMVFRNLVQAVINLVIR